METSNLNSESVMDARDHIKNVASLKSQTSKVNFNVKKILKTFFKLSLSTVVYTVVFIVASAILPYSQGFKDLGVPDNPYGLLFMFITPALVCFTIYYIVKHARFSGKKLFINIVFVMFFVQLFLVQIETLYFGYAFPALTNLDILFIMIAGLLPLLVTVPLMMKFFENKNAIVETKKIDIKSTLKKLGIIGIIYLCVYMLFGYIIAWQFEELRIFYSGSTEKLNFWYQMLNNVKTDPFIFPFQIIRGILFGAFVIPLINMFNSKKVFITTICLIYVYLGVVLISPNVLFPDMVRIAHFFECTTSMLLFGKIVGNILWVNKTKK